MEASGTSFRSWRQFNLKDNLKLSRRNLSAHFSGKLAEIVGQMMDIAVEEAGHFSTEVGRNFDDNFD